MTKVLFVCLGNICRSPMAEFSFKDIVEKRGLKDKFFIESAGTSNEEEGNPVHYGAREKLAEDPWYTHNFDITYHDIMEGLEAFLKFLKSCIDS